MTNSNYKNIKSFRDEDFDLEVYDYLVTIKFDSGPLKRFQPQVLATYILDIEVNNGGFDQFFLNHADEYIDDAIEGLKLFAADKFLEIATKAKEIYIRDKNLYVDKRNPNFNELDEKFYELTHYLPSRVNFIKNNVDKVFC